MYITDVKNYVFTSCATVRRRQHGTARVHAPLLLLPLCVWLCLWERAREREVEREKEREREQENERERERD
jgi:C4-dicarboxylate-specific signal transduction histidine kinase